MAEYASKGVAGTALGLGIAGTVGLVNQMTNGCGGGLLGGLFGGNCGCGARTIGMGAQLQYVSQLQSQNAMLKSQNYSDKIGKQVYAQTLADNKDFRNEMFAFIKPIADEAANNRVEVAVLKAQVEKDKEITALKIDNCRCEISGKIAEVASAANLGITRLSDELGCLKNTVCRITQTIVPASAICPQPMPQYNAWVAPTGTPTQVNVSGTVNTRSATCSG